MLTRLPERMELFWTIVSLCDSEGQKKAYALLDDEVDPHHPWTHLLRTSTSERKMLKTHKEEKHWTSDEARRKFKRRNCILDGVYEMMEFLEDKNNDVIGEQAIFVFLSAC